MAVILAFQSIQRHWLKSISRVIAIGYKKYYIDWHEAIKDPAIEIFDNCAPDDMHYAPSIEALKHGKHVICEKPLAMTVDDAKEMYLTAKKSGLKHMCAHNYRFMPAVRLAKDIIDRDLERQQKLNFYLYSKIGSGLVILAISIWFLITNFLSYNNLDLFYVLILTSSNFIMFTSIIFLIFGFHKLYLII